MLPKKMAVLLILFILLGLLAACKSSELPLEKEDAFLSLVSVDSMNNKIELEYSDVLSSGKIGSTIYLSLANVSNEDVVFPYDFGAKLFTYNESQSTWLEINDLMNIMTRDDHILTTNADPLHQVNVVTVIPDLPNAGQPVTVRIVVVGMVLRDGEPTDETVGAFVDVTLQP